MKVAVIGLGRMGCGVAQGILKAGFDVAVWNRTAEKTRPLIALGAQAAATSQDAVKDADVVVTSLMDDKSVLDAVSGANGFLPAMRPKAVHICTTTISPTCADELEKQHRVHGSYYVSGPVLGRPDAAAAGTLVSYLAGVAEAVRLAEPVAAAYSKQVVAVSDRPAIANCLKLCLNYSLVSLMEVLGEAYTLAEKCGVNPALLNEFYQTAFAHPGFKMYAAKLLEHDFSGPAGFTMQAGYKDLRMMLALASEVGTTLPVGSVVERKIRAALDMGAGDKDWSAFLEITRREAGLS